MKEKELFEYGDINTKRLLLRRINMGDLNDFIELNKDELTNKFLGGIKDVSITKNFIENTINTYKMNKIDTFALVLKEEDKVIGHVGLKIKENDNKGTISYVINSNYWHKGYCTEAMTKLIEIGFNVLKLNRIEADCVKDNIASISVLNKLGMIYEGTKRSSGYDKINKEYFDFNFYSILKDEYKANHLK